MRLLYLILLHLLIYVFPVSGQNKDYPNAVHAKLNVFDYGYLYDQNARIGQGFEFAYFRNISPFLNLGIPFKVELAKLPLKSNNTLTAMADLQIQIGNHLSNARISPYAVGGAGLFMEQNSSAMPMFNAGIGVHLRISKYAFINFQSEYRKATQENRDNIQLGIGYVYLLHKPENIELPDTPLDSDLDSVPDIIDLCPDIAGSPAALGCPDADGDGVSDQEDQCPDIAGVLEAKGCPDKDTDGFPDALDLCPEVYGAINGCPDSDNDGFADNEDDCPGIGGPWNGCPDADYDGIPDKDDACPDEPGSAENSGCPKGKNGTRKDSDGDGFADSEDKCPSLAGPLAGCPDKDGDRFIDQEDQCPDVAGTLNGCPDKDADGIIDSEDPCPTIAGTFGGCPDSDGDGLSDDKDLCPNSIGTAENNGCPKIKEEVRQRLDVAMQAIQFETGSSKLRIQSYAALDEVTGYLRAYPDARLIISGHTDNVGKESNNMRLSTNRAKACYEYFMFRGIEAGRLTYQGFGESQPISENETRQGRELNRRVEFEMRY